MIYLLILAVAPFAVSVWFSDSTVGDCYRYAQGFIGHPTISFPEEMQKCKQYASDMEPTILAVGFVGVPLVHYL